MKTRSIRVLVALALVGVSLYAAAQADFPSKPIRVLVGFAPGGSTDVLARALGQEARKTLGQELIIINKPGATGVISVNEVAAANPDGYTIRVSPSTTFTLTHFFQNVRPDLLEATSALASMEEERIDYAPDVPALIELGYPFSGSTIVYAYGPSGLPASVARRLIEAFAEAGRSPAYIEIASKNGLDSRNLLAGDALGRSLVRDRANIGALVEKLGLKKK